MLRKSLPYLVASLIFSGVCAAAPTTTVAQGRLTRKVAARMLRPYVAAYGRTDDVRFTVPIPHWTTEKLKEESGGVGVLARLGYIECTIHPEKPMPRYISTSEKTIPPRCEVTLTEKGTEASAAWEVVRDAGSLPYIYWLKIPVARAEFVAVTGIREENRNLMTVFYTYRWKPTNDIGKEMVSGVLEAGTAYFRRFDDGWRIVRLAD